MKSTRKPKSLHQTLRITWAIVAKDLVEALKNKNTIGILLTTIPMIFVYYYLPILGTKNEPPRLRVYDEGESVLVSLLENNNAIDLRTYPSKEKMLSGLRSEDIPALGIILPADLDSNLAENGEESIQGFVPAWVNQKEVDKLVNFYESQIAAILGQPIQLLAEGNRVHLEPDSSGISGTASIAFILVIVMIGLIMIPHLMLEEKKTRTIDVLLVSPASAGNLIAGKAIVGLVYVLLGAIVALIVFAHVIVHWWLAILTIILGALFAISMGLILGNIVDSRSQLTIWAWAFILPLLLPVFLVLMGDLLPELANQVIQFFPTAIMLDLLRISYSGVIPMGKTFLLLSLLAVYVAAGLIFAARQVLRMDRQETRLSTTGDIQQTGGNPGVGWLDSQLGKLSQLRKPKQVQDQVLDHPESTSYAPGEHSSLRIIWTIASKDIFATLKNKIALSIIMGTTLIVITSMVPRMLITGRSTPPVVVYDAGRSTILRGLSASDDLRMGFADSLEEMQEIVSESFDIWLGLVVPSNFDSLAGSSEVIELDGYVVHWADPETVSERVATIQDQLGAATWGSVQINVSEDKLYPPARLEGQSTMFALMLSIVVLTLGITLVPLLMVEERVAHTFEVLMVSPARIFEVISGKALAGGFYCLLAVMVVLFLNRVIVVNWGVALIAVVLGGAFAVSLGLLVGLLSDNPTSVGMWSSIILLALLGVTMANTYFNPLLPQLIGAVLDYFPTVAFTRLLGYSLAGEYPMGQMWINAAALLFSALIVSGVLAWRMQLTDR